MIESWIYLSVVYAVTEYHQTKFIFPAGLLPAKQPDSSPPNATTTLNAGKCFKSISISIKRHSRMRQLATSSYTVQLLTV